MKFRNTLTLWTCTLLAALCCNSASATENTPSVNQSIDQFITTMADKNHFDTQYLKGLFKQIHLDDTVTDKMNKPYEAKPWTTYKNFFITDERVALGVKYWQAHAKELARAEQVYGVPASVIVAIIGVESKFGVQQGDFPTFQTLATLAFNYPSRSAFFTKELENYLLMTREQKLEPLAIKGSYAGAIGKPQFMPSSYRAYAVASDGGSHADLINNDADAIVSVANYLKRNGWKRDELVVLPAKASTAALKSLKQDALKPTYTLAELRQQGISWNEKVPSEAKAAFFTVDYENQIQPWVALNNFQVISRYNHNLQYVLAVHEFSQAIQRQKIAAQREHSEQRG